MRRPLVVLASTLVLIYGSVVVLPRAVTAAPGQPATPAAVPSVQGNPVTAVPRAGGAEDAVRPATRLAPRWPQPEVATVDLADATQAQAGKAIRVSRLAEGARVRVETLSPQRVSELGGVGLGVVASRAETGKGAARIGMTFDYSGFADAYGGGFAGRLRLYRLPGCVTQQSKGTCPLTREPVAFRRSALGHEISADIDAAPQGEAAPVYLLAAAVDGSYGGSFGATDLAPTGSWQTGLASGSFTYSYPVPEPTTVAGAGPNLAFAYDSSTVDGLTAATNAQSGWAGLGWTLSPGFIERRYRPCSTDATGSGKKTSQRDWGHLCWESPDQNDGQADTNDPTNSELQLSLAGRSSRIVKDRTTGKYRTQEDYGWTIDYLTGGASGQPYWQVTTLAGDVYRFGYRRDSMWQVPYAGDDTGEPCNNVYHSGGGTNYPGMCQGPWRWNVDQVVDVRKNLMTLNWKRESGKYAWYSTEECCGTPPTYQYTPIDYDRGGYLDRIEWGSNTSVAGSLPSSRMTFNMVSRCADTTTRDDPAANPYPIDTGTGDLSCGFLPSGDWDVPDDLFRCDRYQCASGSPAFFIVRRLDSIVTYAKDPVGGVWDDVHKLQLRFKFIRSSETANGCCTPTLWLDYIRLIGLGGTGEVRLPPVDFDAVELNGRVDWGPMMWFEKPKAMLPRISTVHNGLGGRTEVTYGRPNPCPDGGTAGSSYFTWYNAVRWDRGEQDCFRTYDFWFPDGGQGDTYYGVYHKYLVTKVTERDNVAASPPMVTSYEYLGKPAWAFPVDYLGTKHTFPGVGGTVLVETASWSEALGYQQVRTVKGSGTDPQGYSVSTHSFFRGLYDDVFADGTPKRIRVTDFDGNAFDDRTLLRGQYLQMRQWKMVTYPSGFEELDSERYEYEVTTTGDGPGVNDPAVVKQVRQRSREVLSTGALRYSEERVTHNAVGLPIRVNDFGEDGVSSDNSCTVISYTLVSYPASAEERAGDDCATGTLIDKSASTYDATANLRELKSWSSPTAFTAVAYTYDGYGRVTSTTDELGRVTTTSYSPAVNWPYNGVTVTNALQHRTTTWTSLVHGLATKQSDVDGGRVGETDYDALGRTVAVWGPQEPRSGGTPSVTMSYTVPYNGSIGQPTAPPRVTTAKLQSGQGSSAKWQTVHSYSDGWGRDRELQGPAPFGGGRVVTTTVYDGRGLTAAFGEPVHSTAAAGSGLLNAATTALPSWRKFSYDSAAREVGVALQNYATELNRNTVEHRGADSYRVRPAVGGSTDYWTDGSDRVIRVLEWASATVSYETRYEYDLDGNITKIIDARGNQRVFTYDWEGRLLSSTEPDNGTATRGYDAAGRLVSTVNARGQQVSTVYDELGRRTSLWSGAETTGVKLAQWSYDTVVKGHLANSTSFDGSNAYTDEILAYDANYRPTRTRLTLPAAEGALAGAYEFTAVYDAAGNQIETGYPAVPAAGMAAEKVTNTFTDTGFPSTMTSDYNGGFTYVKSTTYSAVGQAQERLYGAAGQVKRQMTWDIATGRLTNVSTWAKANTATPVLAQNDDLFYDKAANVTRIVDKTLTEPQSECFSYDQRNRLSYAWTTTKPDCSDGWLTSPDGRGPDPYRRQFDYDAAGNITKQDTGGRIGTYTYAAGKNRLEGIAWPDRQDTFAYDATGNMTSRIAAGVATTFAWDALGRLSRATTGGEAVTNIYDADGERLIRRQPGRTTVYLGQMELELAGTTVSARRYYAAGDGAIVAVRNSFGTLTWLLADMQRSQQIAVDDATGRVDRQRYLPFGGRRGARDDVAATDRGFLDRVEDERTGLVHLGARFYDPAVGRFISADPLLDLRMPEWSNPYGYAANNPISKMDPQGLKPECGVGAGCDKFNQQNTWNGKRFVKKKKTPNFRCVSAQCKSQRNNQYRQTCGATCFNKSGKKVSKKGIEKHHKNQRLAADKALRDLEKKAVKLGLDLSLGTLEGMGEGGKKLLDEALNDRHGRAAKWLRQVGQKNASSLLNKLAGLGKLGKLLTPLNVIGTAATYIDKGDEPGKVVVKTAVAVGLGWAAIKLGAAAGAAIGSLFPGPGTIIGGVIGGIAGGVAAAFSEGPVNEVVDKGMDAHAKMQQENMKIRDRCWYCISSIGKP